MINILQMFSVDWQDVRGILILFGMKYEAKRLMVSETKAMF